MFIASLVFNFFLFFFQSLVVPLLIYLLTKDELSEEEVNGMAIDVVTGGVDTVSINCGGVTPLTVCLGRQVPLLFSFFRFWIFVLKIYRKLMDRV